MDYVPEKVCQLAWSAADIVNSVNSKCGQAFKSAGL